MEEKMKKSRKDWIKNIAIIFLSIMLVLTFFSNSIMNYSLPEVATDYVQSGTITAKIRGTGNVESDDPYKVSIAESRTISSVAVKAGDVVEKGQVLFYLEDKDSAELEAAEKELDELILSYTSAILKGEISNQSYDNIQSGNIASTGEYQTRIEAAKAKVDAAQANVDSLTKQIQIAGTTTSGQIDKEAELTRAKADLDNAAARKTEAQANLAAAEAKYGLMKPETELQKAVNDAKAEEATQKTAYDTAFVELNTELIGLKDVTSTEQLVALAYAETQTREQYQTYLTELEAKINTATHETEADDVLQQHKDRAIAKLTAVKETFEPYYAAKSQYETAKKALEDRYGMNSEIASLTAAVNSANNSYNEVKAKVDRLQNEITNNTTNNSKQKADLELQKIEADDALAKAKAEQAQLLMDVSTELNLGNQNSIIAEKQQEIAELREKAVGATIEAPVSGIVTSITKTAGETTQPEEALATMQPAGKGYTLKFSVTNEQAQRVTIGDAAELQNSWFYDNVTAVLTAIRPDPAEPGQKKQLIFTVNGEQLQAGQSLSLSIGERSATYDLLVPNSAVREDNNGKFILVVEVKNSPLGNRYVANRVDVEVLGSDDTKTAINAPLYGYEYVVTTATKPVEAGKLVRLAEN